MKKYMLPTVFILVFLLFISFFWFSYNQETQTRSALKISLQTINANETDYQSFVDSITGVRVSIFDGDGNVLADNTVDKNNMQNHSGRPEFLSAKIQGYGEDIRISDTTGQKSIYVMAELKNGVYVRLAQPVALTFEFLLWLFVPLLFLSLCLAVLILIFARRNQNDIIRREFVANVSHELKTPLTSIKGFAELVAAGLVDDGITIREYQNKIISQSDRLLNMINDILYLSKVESTRPQALVLVNTRSIAEQAAGALKFMADEKDIIIQISGEGRIKAEIEPVYEMVYNLVDNSIKYGNKGGFVKVVLDGGKITVTDDGIGIPAKDIDRVFERFYRVDKSRNAQRGGTGLGLSIVKHTAIKYKGKINIKSNLDEGTEINVFFMMY